MHVYPRETTSAGVYLWEHIVNIHVELLHEPGCMKYITTQVTEVYGLNKKIYFM